MLGRLLSTVLGILVVLPVGWALEDLDQQKVLFGSSEGTELGEQIPRFLAKPWAQIEGFWREVGVASDQNLALKTPKRIEGVFLTMSGSNLTVKVVFNNSGSCETETTVGSAGGTAGRFAFPGHREMHVLDTDYKRYAILRVSLLWRGKEVHVLKYFTRSLKDEDEPGFWKFREMTADKGLYLVARHGRCAELLKEVTQGPEYHPSACSG